MIATDIVKARETAERVLVGNYTGGDHVALARALLAPVPMLLWCPECRGRHVDEGEFATKPHHTHACQHCGHVWRPAIQPTTGVQFLPGFKDEVKP